MSGERSAAPPLAVTMGDPAGISLEITIMAWQRRRQASLPPFALYADPDALSARARTAGLEASFEVVTDLRAASAVFADSLPVVAVRLDRPAEPGRPDAGNARAVIRSIDLAGAAVMRGEAAALVTNPIAKAVLYRSGFDHPGHTEYLAHLAQTLGARGSIRPVMMLMSDELKVVPLTIHIPLAAVPGAITPEAIAATVLTTSAALKHDFAIPEPRIAVTGLNPHAGEGGTLGREEVEVIAPVLRELAVGGIAVTGPHPADTLFHAAARKGYDAVIAMYHDQALIPLKTLAFDTGVNVTLGLPFVRTSPDHGTAFDIAGTGRADPASLIASIKVARDIARRRAQSHEGRSA